MNTKNFEHIPAIDQLRFFAAFLVFCFHAAHLAWGNWKPHPEAFGINWLIEGHSGVSLFFVLSGFIFMLIAMSGKDIDYKVFIKNRLLRIFPLFLFFFFIAISVSRNEFNGSDIFYLLFSNLGKAPTSNSFITGAAWTISIEFTFYLVFPFIASFAKRYGISYLLRIIFLLMIVKIASYTVSGNPTHMFYSTLVGRFDQFIWGMIFAILYSQLSSISKNKGLMLLVIWATLYLALSSWQAHKASYFSEEVHNPIWIFWGTIESLIWGSLILLYTKSEFHFPSLIERFLNRGGAISYSIYLWHGLIIHLIFQLVTNFNFTVFPKINIFIAILATFPLVFFIASISYQVIERPFLLMRSKYLSN